jgi:cephalosporin hydroxylase
MGLAKQFASIVASMVYRPTDEVAIEYHKWYYGTRVFDHTTWLGVPCMKSVSDTWNYQEILVELRPTVLIEFGTRYGGSALFFASVMRQLGYPFRILSVDIDQDTIREPTRQDPDIELLASSSTDPQVADRIRELRIEYPGPVFAILDSLHTADHVLQEMETLRPLLISGDYLIVEDSNINGHPVLPGWGPGPYEALEAYEREYAGDYRHDQAREAKFGFTFATNGFLIREPPH